MKISTSTTLSAWLLLAASTATTLAQQDGDFDYFEAAKAEVSHCLDHLYNDMNLPAGPNTLVGASLASESCGDGRDRVTVHLMANTCPIGATCITAETEIATVEFLCNNSVESRRCHIVDECASDDDCNSSGQEWCRPTQHRRSTRSECVPLATEGGTCQGFGDPFDQIRCESGLKCNGSGFVAHTEPETGICVPPDDPCTTDGDCGDFGWCRVVDDTNMIRECVDYLQEGQACSGFVPPYMQTRCDPSLTCLPDDPMIPDLPGTCQHSHEVSPTNPGCRSDEDCRGNGWCRDVDESGSGNKECVRYRFVGEECTGFVMSSFLELCDPSAVCTPNNDMLPDGPGTCEMTNQVEPPNEFESCTDDEDCSEGNWCRPRADIDGLADVGFECVPYKSEGQSCSGFAISYMTEQCDPSKNLICTMNDPALPDAPGICVVSSNNPPPSESEEEESEDREATEGNGQQLSYDDEDDGDLSVAAKASLAVGGVALFFAIVAFSAFIYFAMKQKKESRTSDPSGKAAGDVVDEPSSVGSTRSNSRNHDETTDESGDIESAGP